MLKNALLLCVLATLLSACASSLTSKQYESSVPPPKFNAELFVPVTPISVSEITKLSDAQKEHFFAFLNDPKFALTPRLQRLATYMGILVDQFVYSEYTYTAQQSLEAKAGNCLSLTVLTTAFAQLADVDISYQLLDQNPVYSIDNNLLVTSDHLRAVLMSKPEFRDGERFGSRSGVRIDYFQTDGLSYVDKVSVDEQLSLFFSNLAVDHLASKKVDSAFAYAKRALEIYPHNASALNTIGIAHRQKGDVLTAEKIYQHGAQYFSKAPMFIRNYANLLETQSRQVDLSALVSASSKEHDHPFQWVRAGKLAHQQGNYEHALRFYKRALKIAPELHQVYVFASVSSFAAGRKMQSRRYLRRALALADDHQHRKSYKGKLSALRAD